MSDEVTQTLAWFVETGQMPEKPTPSARQSAFYLGMQLEELAEKLSSFLSDSDETVAAMITLGHAFKRGELDDIVSTALQNPEIVGEMLDGDCDLLWVTIGAASAQGADIAGAYGEVLYKNYKKRFEDGTFHRAKDTGRVLKPEGWTPPELTQFLHSSLRANKE